MGRTEGPMRPRRGVSGGYRLAVALREGAEMTGQHNASRRLAAKVLIDIDRHPLGDQAAAHHFGPG